jgi:hypothetical protein
MPVFLDCIVAGVIVGILNHILIPRLLDWDTSPPEIEDHALRAIPLLLLKVFAELL